MTPPTVLIASPAKPNAASALGGHSSFDARDPGQVSKIRETARAVIRTGDPASLALTEQALQAAAGHEDSTGETHQLLGLAQFLQKNYAAAQANLEIAVKANPSIADWRILLDRASRNAQTRLDASPEPMDLFDPVALTTPPAQYLREPQGIGRPPDPGPFDRVVSLWRDIGGRVLGGFFGVVVDIEGRKGVEQGWRDWPRLTGPMADLRRDIKLAGIRKWMNHKTLKSTEEPGTLVNSQHPGQTAPGVDQLRPHRERLLEHGRSRRKVWPARACRGRARIRLPGFVGTDHWTPTCRAFEN